MSDKEQSHSERIQKKTSRKVLKWILFITAGVVLLFFVGVPAFLSSSGGTNLLLGKINSSVDGEVQMEDLSVGWFRGVKLTNLLYTDTAGQTSVKVQSLQTRPKYVSLLGGKVKLGKTVIERPEVYVKVPAFEDKTSVVGGVKDAPSAVRPSPAIPLEQIDLELRDGKVTIEMPGDTPQTVSFTNIASKVLLADAGKDSQIDVSMQVEDGTQPAQVTAKGTLAADKSWTLKNGDFDVTVSKLQLGSLKPLFALAGQEQMDMAGELNADATIRVSDNTVQQIKADATITDFAQGSGDQRIAFEEPVRVSALVSGTGPEMQIEKLVVDSQFCDVDCVGTLQSLDYKIDADLAQTQRFAQQFAKMGDLKLAGQLAANGNLKLTEESVAIAGKGAVSSLSVQKQAVMTPAMDASLDYDVAVDKVDKLLQVRSVDLASSSLGTLEIENMQLPLGPRTAGQLAMNADADLDLQKTLSLAQAFVPSLAENQISGRLKAAAMIETTGSRIRFKAEQASVDKLKIVRKDSEPFVQDRVTLQGDVIVDTADKTIDIRTLDLQGTQGETLIKVTKGKVEKKVSQNQTELKGDFEAEYDWKTVSALAPVPGLAVKGKRKGGFTFQSRYPTDKPDTMLANLNATGNLGFDNASYKGLNFGPTELNMSVQKGLMSFTIPRTTVNEGTMQFAGWIDLNEKPKFLRVRNAEAALDMVHINDAVTSNYLQFTNPMFAGAVSTQGVATLKIHEMEIPLDKGHRNAMNMKANLNIESMSMRPGSGIGGFLKLMNMFGVETASWGANIAVLPTDFLLDNGVLSYDSMKIVMSDKQFDFSGRINLDNSLTMSVVLPWTITGDTLTPEQQSQNGVRVPITGTLNKPEFKMENLIKQQGEQLLRQGIQKGLEGLFK